MRTFSPPEARAVYDRIGALQDTQRFYEDRALAVLVAHGRFDQARAVFELGCGTGRLAERLLARAAPPGCRYVGVDISATMVRLATARLGRWAPRAQVRPTDGALPLPEPDGSFDRFVSTYVLDLLSEGDIHAVLADAHRLLEPGGRLCVVSLTEGDRPLTRLVSRLWRAIHAASPKLLGGCRPIRLLDFLPASRWRLEHHEIVSAFGISSEVVVAARA